MYSVIIAVNIFLAIYTNFTVPSVPPMAALGSLQRASQEVKVEDLHIKVKEDPVRERRSMSVTGYSSTPEETDDTPRITASGTFCRWGVIATNDLPFGTEVRIPDLFGDEIFRVEDRMNKRYSDRMDVWFPSKKEASHFGIYRDVVIEVLKAKDGNEMAFKK